MSGSLTRLVLRAQGRLPVAEPLLPSRYATGPQAAGFSEDVGIELAAQPSSSVIQVTDSSANASRFYRLRTPKLP